MDDKIGAGNPLITAFMPNGPNPTTGFIVFVPASEVIPLDQVRDRLTTQVLINLSSRGHAPEIMEQLEALLRKHHGDKPVIIMLAGQSGIGKTVLVRTFLDELRQRDEVIVLAPWNNNVLTTFFPKLLDDK